MGIEERCHQQISNTKNLKVKESKVVLFIDIVAYPKINNSSLPRYQNKNIAQRAHN
jgi:hypothetical protein